MRLLYFIPRYAAGLMGNRIHSEVLELWRARGVEPEVATLDAAVRGHTAEDQGGIMVHRLPVSAGLPLKLANRGLNLLLHYPYLAGAILHYRRLLAVRSYDLVHVETSFPLGLVAGLVPRQRSPLLAITLPGADIMAEPDYDYGYGRFRAVRALLPRIFGRADLLRADSPQIHTLAQSLGAPADRMITVPYNITADSYPPAGVDLALFRASCREEIQMRHALDPRRPVIVSVNRLHPFKGFAYLIDAAAALRAQGIDPQVLIVGPNRSTPRFGDYGEFLRRRAREQGVADAVVFVGAVEHAETLRYMAAADVAVVASVAESFSRVAIEAAAAGTPVVITRTTGASDYIVQHGCGLAVEPRDGHSLAQGCARLLSDRALWQSCADRAAPMAAGFSSEAIAQQLLEAYRGLGARTKN
ncbi:MAG TPA: glycosyltransferase family 4 protein [Roseiflexaceae bacterium]|nr:glycosyltransferase family 4 protein [Roseiflexaceae bacterium]